MGKRTTLKNPDCLQKSWSIIVADASRYPLTYLTRTTGWYRVRMYINVKKVEPINGGLQIWIQIKIRVQSYASNYW